MFKNIISYVLGLTLLFLCSCAEEGPYTLGKLECQVEVSSISPNTAVVSVSIPDSKDNLLNDGHSYGSIYLSDHPLSSSQKMDEVIKGNRVDSSNDSKYSFTNLIPNTTYYVILENNIYFNGKNDYSEVEYYYTGFSFTTSAEGDYSKFGEPTAEVVEAESGFAAIRITLPEGLRLKNSYMDPYSEEGAYLEVSTSPNMSDAIEGKVISSSVGTNQIIFLFTGLKDSQYYLRLRGYFMTASGYVFDQMITLNVKNPIDLSRMDMTKSLCETYFAGADFAIFQFSFPKSFNWHNIDQVRLKIADDSYYGYAAYSNIDRCSFYIYCPHNFIEGENITIILNGEYSISNIDNNFYSDFKFETIYSSDKTILQNPKSNTVFAGGDYSLVKIEYPQELSCDYIDAFYIGDGKSYPDTYGRIPYIINTRDYVLVNNAFASMKDHYLREKGKFNFNNFRGVSVDGHIINIDGKIRKGDNNKNLFNVSTEKVNDLLNIVITLSEEFDNTYKSTYPWLEIRSEQDQRIGDAFSDPDLSTNKKIVFPLGEYETESLKQGENYILKFDNLYLNYIPENLYLDYDSSYRIVWTY